MADSPPKFRVECPKSLVLQCFFEGRPLTLGAEMPPPKSRGCGLQGRNRQEPSAPNSRDSLRLRQRVLPFPRRPPQERTLDFSPEGPETPVIRNTPSTQNLKIPNQTIFLLSGTVWQTVFFFFPLSLMKLAWWSWASGYQTNLSLCFVGKLLPD